MTRKKNPSQARPKAKRSLFEEVAEGLEALAAERRGKRTLRTHPKSSDRRRT